MERFRDIVLRVGKGAGLLGVCNGLYGMVEAQGRGTLHCHMLIWIDGNPSPSLLREKMNDSCFKATMFAWLERLIKTELPGTMEVQRGENVPLTRPKRSTDSIDPRTMFGPCISGMDKQAFNQAFDSHVSDLVCANNWHEHRASCWIYLRPGEEKSDAKCRMRIDGITRALSAVDEESGSILLRRLHPWINEYNPVIMFLLKCNMDLQYIGSGEGAKAALYYITDYITKPSLKVHAGMSALVYAIQKNREKYKGVNSNAVADESRSLVNKMVHSMMSRQEMSHQQIMSYYVGGGDCYTSHTFSVLQWGRFSRFVATME
ncbi:hypothetical protein CALVIDRAFT_469531, partial [Calocera viscosa TUFC12733]